MKWSDVAAGQSVKVKGEVWQVLKVDSGAVTMLHPGLGERTGNPPPDAEVEVVARTSAPAPNAAPYQRREHTPKQLLAYERAMQADVERSDPEFRRLRQFAKEEGFTENDLVNLDVDGIRDLIGRKRMEAVAKANNVPVREVEDAHIRLTLGATVIAELRTAEPPATPKVEVMDAATMRNHLHFFHDTFPGADVELDELVKLHDDAQEHARHTHSVPF